MSTEAAADPSSLVVWGGFGLAFVFGAIANRSNFCTMGAVSDVVNMGHWGRMRMWLLAIAVAIVGTNLLFHAGLIDLPKTIYQRPTLSWLSLLVGGVLFGVGMSLAGGCANKNLIRVGGGSVRSLVVLTFLAISAYMTLKGLFGQWRASVLDPVSLDLGKIGLSDQSLASLVAKITGIDAKTALMATLWVVGLALAAFAFADKRFRANATQWSAGIVIGAVVVAGWYLTGHLGFGENPETLENVYFATNTRTLESMSFVAPTAYTLELLMLWTDKSLRVTFGIATALGVIAGSLAWALASKTFRWEGFASFDDLRNQLIGAVLMGFGGVTAMGCTVGQGLTGVSTLAIGSFIALAGIVAGSAATLKYITWRAERDA
ncbi:YeeE/YedE family protein [Calidifontimicrobium sp. SYSU G02091]|uniref:YeeE/YedE family protein n=1 Tax=Calidifontimicrobium sp. SYSU G02091 TaxID=2926421 RepID=UPI001F5305C4|nr:YeeE/YedE family protein [Calidifontimicrobium sp. SYSU G02091]MCI1193042.1 YeeE/YedE family protein [Calidifontimicrobium sp. SYSU G02091]